MPRETDVIYGMTAGHGVTIEVDEAIFGLLTYEQRPGEAYNDVVRRLLGMPPKDGCYGRARHRPAPRDPDPPAGAMAATRAAPACLPNARTAARTTLTTPACACATAPARSGPARANARRTPNRFPGRSRTGHDCS